MPRQPQNDDDAASITSGILKALKFGYTYEAQHGEHAHEALPAPQEKVDADPLTVSTGPNPLSTQHAPLDQHTHNGHIYEPPLPEAADRLYRSTQPCPLFHHDQC